MRSCFNNVLMLHLLFLFINAIFFRSFATSHGSPKSPHSHAQAVITAEPIENPSWSEQNGNRKYIEVKMPCDQAMKACKVPDVNITIHLWSNPKEFGDFCTEHNKQSPHSPKHGRQSSHRVDPHSDSASSDASLPDTHHGQRLHSSKRNRQSHARPDSDSRSASAEVLFQEPPQQHATSHVSSVLRFAFEKFREIDAEIPAPSAVDPTETETVALQTIKDAVGKVLRRLEPLLERRYDHYDDLGSWIREMETFLEEPWGLRRQLNDRVDELVEKTKEAYDPLAQLLRSQPDHAAIHDSYRPTTLEEHVSDERRRTGIEGHSSNSPEGQWVDTVRVAESQPRLKSHDRPTALATDVLEAGTQTDAESSGRLGGPPELDTMHRTEYVPELQTIHVRESGFPDHAYAEHTAEQFNVVYEDLKRICEQLNAVESMQHIDQSQHQINPITRRIIQLMDTVKGKFGALRDYGVIEDIENIQKDLHTLLGFRFDHDVPLMESILHIMDRLHQISQREFARKVYNDVGTVVHILQALRQRLGEDPSGEDEVSRATQILHDMQSVTFKLKAERDTQGGK